MKVLINYADDKYKKCQKMNTWTGKHIAGFDKVIEYSPKDIDSGFIDKNFEIFKYSRGNGLWLWKPYFILKTLKSLNDGDMLVYLDSGAFFCRSAKPIFRILEQEEIYLTALPFSEQQFTKKKVFSKLKCESEIFYLDNQIQGTIIATKRTTNSIQFFEKFLKLCCDIELLAPDIYPEGVNKDFISHREDQSILSVLAHKEGIISHKDPTQYGALPYKYGKGKYQLKLFDSNDTYKPFIVLHRSGGMKFKTCFNQWLCCILPISISKQFVK